MSQQIGGIDWGRCVVFVAVGMYLARTRNFEALAQMSSIKRVPIDFTAIKPGFIATDFIKHKYFMTMQLPYAAKRIIRAIEKRKNNAVIDWRWKIAVALLHLIPTSIWRKIKI